MSFLHKLFRQIRSGILRLLFGSKIKDCIEKSLKTYQNLPRLNPSNTLEAFMVQPSDIWEHLASLYMLTVEFDLKTVLELGTAEGESTVALLQAVHEIDGSVYSIDINPCQEAQETIKNLGLMDRWIFSQVDDLEVKWEKRIDHLFIDTSHEFKHTLSELQKFEPFVREGGIITLHDIISFPEVMDAITEYLKKRSDLRLYKYLHNNGLAVIFKGERASVN